MTATSIVALVVLGLIDVPNATGMKVGPRRCTDSEIRDPFKREECVRLTTFAQQLLDQASHAPVASVELYQESRNILRTYGGFADFAIVSFKLADGTNKAFFVRCGVGVAKDLCFDLRPLEPGFSGDEEPYDPDPVVVP